MADPKKILIVRRDNIGDLVCTTPLFTALRGQFPAAKLHALVNSYNAPVLAGHPAVDVVHAYTKLKHVGPEASRADALLRRLALAWQLRRERFDIAIIAPPAARLDGLMRWAFGRARVIEGVSITETAQLHHVEEVFTLLAPLGIVGVPPPVSIFSARRPAADRVTLAVHISARKPSQRWPDQRYAMLIRHVVTTTSWDVCLLWSPGAKDDSLHPGDDERAANILESLAAEVAVGRVRGTPTHNLGDLIAAIAEASFVFCSDGGAMHIAAGLGKPIVCLFGQSNATRWRPWGVPHVVLQTESQNAADIQAQSALSALFEFAHQLKMG